MIVYIIKIESDNKYKIGYTKKKLSERIKNLQTGSPDNIIAISEFKTKYPTKLEKYLHRYYSDQRLEGEWFCLEESDIVKIKKQCLDFESNMDFLIESGNPFVLKKI